METLFLRISQSPYIQIQGLEMHPCPPDPWERSFRVRG